MKRKRVALSASYYNCPPVAELLLSCETVHTTNKYVLANFKHPNIIPFDHRATMALVENCEVIEFSELFQLFNNWVAFEATNKELEDWYVYFGSTDCDVIRTKAKNCLRT